MSQSHEDQGRGGEPGGDGHALAPLRRLARLPLSEKIAWLEQAHRVVRHLARQPAPERLKVESAEEVPAAGEENSLRQGQTPVPGARLQE